MSGLYQAVLRRAPDTRGLDAYVNHLVTGAYAEHLHAKWCVCSRQADKRGLGGLCESPFFLRVTGRLVPSTIARALRDSHEFRARFLPQEGELKRGVTLWGVEGGEGGGKGGGVREALVRALGVLVALEPGCRSAGGGGVTLEGARNISRGDMEGGAPPLVCEGSVGYSLELYDRLGARFT